MFSDDTLAAFAPPLPPEPIIAMSSFSIRLRALRMLGAVKGTAAPIANDLERNLRRVVGGLDMSSFQPAGGWSCEEE